MGTKLSGCCSMADTTDHTTAISNRNVEKRASNHHKKKKSKKKHRHRHKQQIVDAEEDDNEKNKAINISYDRLASIDMNIDDNLENSTLPTMAMDTSHLMLANPFGSPPCSSNKSNKSLANAPSNNTKINNINNLNIVYMDSSSAQKPTKRSNDDVNNTSPAAVDKAKKSLHDNKYRDSQLEGLPFIVDDTNILFAPLTAFNDSTTINTKTTTTKTKTTTTTNDDSKYIVNITAPPNNSKLKPLKPIIDANDDDEDDDEVDNDNDDKVDEAKQELQQKETQNVDNLNVNNKSLKDFTSVTVSSERSSVVSDSEGDSSDDTFASTQNEFNANLNLMKRKHKANLCRPTSANKWDKRNVTKQEKMMKQEIEKLQMEQEIAEMGSMMKMYRSEYM